MYTDWAKVQWGEGGGTKLSRKKLNTNEESKPTKLGLDQVKNDSKMQADWSKSKSDGEIPAEWDEVNKVKGRGEKDRN